MATVKKPMKKAIKKASPKMMRQAAPMMQAPPSGSQPMGGGPMMKKGGKVKKAQKGASVDSTSYFKNMGAQGAKEMAAAKTPVAQSVASNKIAQATKGEARQKVKKTMKMGGKVKKCKSGCK